MEKLLINMPITDFRIKTLNSNIGPVNRLLEQCDSYFAEDVPLEHPKKSSTYMGFACANLSMAYILTTDERYYNELKRWVNAILGYEEWGYLFLVNVDLSTSFLLTGLSLTYNWLSDKLDITLKQKIENKLIKHAEIMYSFRMETMGSGWPTNYWQNHNWINTTALAITGYALKDVYAGASKWIYDAKENFDIVFDALSDDGSNYEGTAYWRYGIIWLQLYADLEKKHGSKNYFESSNFMKNTFDYRLYQMSTNEKEVINFGDCHDRKSSHSIAAYRKFASEYQNQYAQYLADQVTTFLHQEQMESGIKPGILPEAFLEVLWFDAGVNKKSYNDLPKVKHFEDLGLISIRSGWTEEDFIFNFKCSAPGGEKQFKKNIELLDKQIDSLGWSHQHPDNNSFIVVNKNAYCFIDDGYNRNIQFNNHNNVSVDGTLLKVMGGKNPLKDSLKAEMDKPGFSIDQFKGTVTRFEEKEDYVIVEGETSGMYDTDLKLTNYTRTVLVRFDGIIISVDVLNSEENHIYTQHMHSDAEPINSDNKFSYRNKLTEYDMYCFSNKETEFRTEQNSVKAIMTPQEPEIYRELVMQTVDTYNKEKMQDIIFINVIDLKRENCIHDVEYKKDLNYLKIKTDNNTIEYIVDENGISIH